MVQSLCHETKSPKRDTAKIENKPNQKPDSTDDVFTVLVPGHENSSRESRIIGFGEHNSVLTFLFRCLRIVDTDKAISRIARRSCSDRILFCRHPVDVDRSQSQSPRNPEQIRKQARTTEVRLRRSFSATSKL